MTDPAPSSAAADLSAEALSAMPRHTVFFVSDGTGITAETFGNSILSQFAIKPRHLRRPFIDTPDKAHQVVREINHTAEHDGRKPIVFISRPCLLMGRELSLPALSDVNRKERVL